ncbi:iron uptake system protein EfeO [Thioclava sp. DLFJ4-1]|uniref:iron uptake system protein EfeO n=2 Tax=unclassified Thioclava TaxID=2621713 RepID=UPI001AEF77F2|nr:iron uptake system protein EfeO [Thioclava sp. DLFJ4-1]
MNMSSRARRRAVPLLAATAFFAQPALADAPTNNGAAQVAITLTGENGGACVLDHDSAAAGPITFTVTNESAPAISELELLSDSRILGEKENLAPGLPASSFTVTLDGGDYRIYCPGAAEDTVAFTVTGESKQRAQSAIGDLLDEGTAGYANYVEGMVGAMVTASERLAAKVDAGDVEGAKEAYAQARPFYERIEPDVEGFVLPGTDPTDNSGNLDYLIDMRASNLDPAVGWHGFHAVERDLFEKGEITDETKAYAAELVKNVKMLADLSGGIEYRPEDLANGAAALLEEVQSGKISGEEEAYSHIDLVDFAANIEGAHQAFAFLEPGLKRIDPDVAETIAQRFADVQTMLEDYRDPDALGGYKIYDAELRKSDAVKLSRAIQMLQEPLSRIAEKVATAS